ncbi:DUF2388 domain-containing protein [Stutzerimonas azotifigens]|uniref:DUF2388 domain-containing protein n=1 Tax=Stutzerimonas azotifigens TaxID=291995 RepID=UPI00041B7F34|nr:DUF2388 domain-containing protein [Stutzerimonas azotifigens]
MTRPLVPLFALPLLLAAGAASAGSFVATTDLVVGGLLQTTDSTTNLTDSIFDNKIVLAARDDAARFVASDGSVRGAHLEAALRHIRSQTPALEGTDLQLAEAILTL